MSIILKKQYVNYDVERTSKHTGAVQKYDFGYTKFKLIEREDSDSNIKYTPKDEINSEEYREYRIFERNQVKEWFKHI